MSITASDQIKGALELMLRLKELCTGQSPGVSLTLNQREDGSCDVIMRLDWYMGLGERRKLHAISWMAEGEHIPDPSYGDVIIQQMIDKMRHGMATGSTELRP